MIAYMYPTLLTGISLGRLDQRKAWLRLFDAEYHCKMAGASNLAYPTVAAGGSSATIIHYGANDKVRLLKSKWLKAIPYVIANYVMAKSY